MSDWDETRKRRSGTSVRAKPKNLYSVLFACRKCRRSIAVASKKPIGESEIPCENCGGMMKRA